MIKAIEALSEKGWILAIIGILNRYNNFSDPVIIKAIEALKENSIEKCLEELSEKSNLSGVVKDRLNELLDKGNKLEVGTISEGTFRQSKNGGNKKKRGILRLFRGR